jgi:Fe-S oxidoreductase
VLAARATLFQERSTPKAVTKLLSSLAKTGNTYGQTRHKLAQKHSDTVYFPGCNIRYRHPEILESSVKLLNHVGVNAVVMEGTDCCGAPALLAGNPEQYDSISRANSSWIDSTQLIFSCPIGLQIVKEGYRETKKIPLASHLTEVLSARSSSIHFLDTRETVTYHDPCYLARLLKVIDPPRNLLLSVPSLKLVEMTDSKENTRCCGSGAGITEQSSRVLSLRVAAARIKQAREVGAERVITSCPYCLDQLRKVSDGLPVDEISVFLASRLQPLR